jgi:hypothetical protein
MKRILTLLGIVVGIGYITNTSSAQSKDDDTELRRFEIGGHFTYLRRVDANPATVVFQRLNPSSTDSGPGSISELGLGARVTYNITKYAAIEIEGNLFPEDKRSNRLVGVPQTVTEPGGRKLQAVAGPKIGYRGTKFGIFGKLRPGIVRLDRYDAVVQIGPPGNFFVLSEVRNKVGFVNIDVGGVFEYYRTRRTFFRVDIGDSIIYYRKLPPKELNPSLTRHNLQINIGFGFRL